MYRPPPPGPPGMYLRLLLGGAESEMYRLGVGVQSFSRAVVECQEKAPCRCFEAGGMDWKTGWGGFAVAR